jgi:hypothetical protein
MRKNAAGISPANIAIAEQVMMVAMAATGDMVKATGTSKATAIVALRPGI